VDLADTVANITDFLVIFVEMLPPKAMQQKLPSPRGMSLKAEVSAEGKISANPQDADSVPQGLESVHQRVILKSGFE
jgi:hypothetical protein